MIERLTLCSGPGGGVGEGEAAEEVKYLRFRRSLKVFQLALQALHFTLTCQFDTLSLNQEDTRAPARTAEVFATGPLSIFRPLLKIQN